MPENQFSSSVDSILENLKKEQTGASPSERSVTQILAELGLESNGAVDGNSRPAGKANPPAAPKAADRSNIQTFWNTGEIRLQNAIKEKKTERTKTDDEEIRPPRLSDTLQMDKEFQKFFSESIAVIPDIKQEQEEHPGFFARFVRRKKSDEIQSTDEDEGIYGQAENQDSFDGEIPLELPVQEENTWENPLEVPAQEEKMSRPSIFKKKVKKAVQTKQTRQKPEEDFSVFTEESEPSEKVQSVEIPLEEPAPQPEPPQEVQSVEIPLEEPVQQPEPPQEVQSVEIPLEEPVQQPEQQEPLEEPQSVDTIEQPIEQPEQQSETEDITGNIQIPLADTNTIPFEPNMQQGTDWMDEFGDTQAVEPQQDEQKKRFKLPRFWGSEDAAGDAFDEPEHPEYVEDYENPGDAPAVQQDLEHLRFVTAIRTLISGVIGIMLLYLGLAVGESPLPPIAAIDPSVAPTAFLTVNLLMLLAACAVNWRVFVNGIRGIWGTPTPDTIPAMAGIAAALQIIILLMSAESFDASKVTIFAAPAALLLCFSALGKYLLSGVFRTNFEMLTSGTNHVAAFAVEDEELSRKIAQGLGEPEPRLLANRPTTLIRGFLRRSFSVRDSDYMLQKMSWLLAIAALVATAITLVTDRGTAAAFTVLAGTLCLGGPISVTLMSAVPSMLMQKSAARVGAIIPGWDSIAEMGATNMVVVGARDLFPEKCVRLHAIKTFEKERIDLAILYAASVLVPACDTLRDVFMNIIQGKTDILFPVENLQNEPGYGFTAWVQHNRIIIGNRAMMEKQGVEMPSLDYENRYTKGVKQPVYLAVSGRLFGMFLVSYKADQQAAQVLSDLRNHGISVLVKSDDFSLTSSLIKEIYGLPDGCLKVMNAAERKDLEPLVEYSQSTEGCMGHLGSFASFVGGLLAASDAANAERLSSLVQAAGIVVSAVLSILLAFTGGISELALPALILYQAAWTVLTLIISLLKKY